jgi:hypothetical protein
MADATTTTWASNEKPFLWQPEAALSFFDVCNKVDVHLADDVKTVISREIVVTIFFHESGFSNIMQQTNTGKGPAVGFGQMEIFNPDKVDFFKTLGFDSRKFKTNPPPPKPGKAGAGKTVQQPAASVAPLAPLTAETILKNKDFAIEVHCKYFAWLYHEGYSPTMPGQKGFKSAEAILGAQTGGGRNRHFVGEFITVGRELEKATNAGDRRRIIDTLNKVRWYFPGPEGIPAGATTKTTPDGTHTLVHHPVTLERYKKYWDFTLPERDVAFGTRL